MKISMWKTVSVLVDRKSTKTTKLQKLLDDGNQQKQSADNSSIEKHQQITDKNLCIYMLNTSYFLFIFENLVDYNRYKRLQVYII